MRSDLKRPLFLCPKGVKPMCDHKRIKCVNCVFICIDCGAVIPAVKPEEPAVEEKPTKKKGAKAK